MRATRAILRQFRDFTDSYVDDNCAVFFDDWRDYFEHWDKYLSTLKHEHITPNLQKCRFDQHTVRFCGEIIRSETRSYDLDKVAAAKHIAVPEIKKTAARFVGIFLIFS